MDQVAIAQSRQISALAMYSLLVTRHYYSTRCDAKRLQVLDAVIAGLTVKAIDDVEVRRRLDLAYESIAKIGHNLQGNEAHMIMIVAENTPSFATRLAEISTNLDFR